MSECCACVHAEVCQLQLPKLSCMTLLLCWCQMYGNAVAKKLEKTRKIFKQKFFRQVRGFTPIGLCESTPHTVSPPTQVSHTHAHPFTPTQFSHSPPTSQPLIHSSSQSPSEFHSPAPTHFSPSHPLTFHTLTLPHSFPIFTPLPPSPNPSSPLSTVQWISMATLRS